MDKMDNIIEILIDNADGDRSKALMLAVGYFNAESQDAIQDYTSEDIYHLLNAISALAK